MDWYMLIHCAMLVELEGNGRQVCSWQKYCTAINTVFERKLLRNVVSEAQPGEKAGLRT
jgi:hypothetical protein